MTPDSWADNRFFEGEVEPCINGSVVATGAYFDLHMTPLVDLHMTPLVDLHCRHSR